MRDIIIVGIETSCDETSVAVVKNGRDVLSNIISSQIDTHKIFGGVVPEIASRKHIEVIDYVFDKAICDAKIALNDIDAISVTYGPGLVGSLLVGLSFAKALSMSINKPFIGINHIEGHICSNYISNKNLTPEFLALIVSGGHTNLIHVKDYGKYKIYGRTHDDACGETYDKIARALGFEYPGGKKLEASAKLGADKYIFPRGNILSNIYDFTFSGLKSHTINLINKLKSKNELSDIEKNNISKAFQDSIIDTLVMKTINLCNELNLKKIAICGGVSANMAIKDSLNKKAKENKIEFFAPKQILSTDNAAMIASAGYYRFINNEFSDLTLNAYPNLEFSEEINE